MNTGLKTENTADIDAEIQETNAYLQNFEQEIHRVNSPEELEALEREIRQHTDHLAALLLQKQLQANLDSEEQQAQEAELIHAWPGRMKSEGYETVRILTLGGFYITVRARYYRRVCDRKNGKRHKGVYGALVLLGIHDRCTPGLSSMVSAWSALLSSFDEVHQVLGEQGINLGVKVIRKLTYRYADVMLHLESEFCLS